MLPEAPADDAVLLATRNWLERAVIGLSLCPFAKAVHAKDQIRYVISAAETQEALVAELRRELVTLSEADPDVVDTTLVIVPRMLDDFLEYNDFLYVADRTLLELELEGVLQIASFHPRYEFADSDPNDVGNSTNRSPYPMLHLLREASVERAVQAFPEAERIFERNVARLRALGHAGFARVLAGEDAVEGETQTEAAKDGDFAKLGLSPALLEVVAELGFEQLTPIQAASIPPLLAGKDLVGQSKTGSGKTLAFALPMLERLRLDVRELQGLVLCPTRELAAQVAREFRRLGRRLPGLGVVVLAGGEPVREQARALERGVHLAIGTPGRVLDHLQRRTLRVHRVATVVLDEADRMLDMGFLPDIEKVLKALPESRQAVFFSATFPAAIRALGEKHQKAPVRVSAELEAEERPDIVQLVVPCSAEKRRQTLRWVLENYPHQSALVFVNLKLDIAELEPALRASGSSVASLHGDLEQRDRDRVMAKFRNGSTRVLLATDVAARGIDLESLDLVVNFELPRQPEIYVHRIGRTGRAGKSGLAVSLCAPAEEAQLQAVEAFTGVPLTKVRPESGSSRRAPDPAARVSAAREAPMETLRVSGGRKDKLRPGDILGALTGEAGKLLGDDVGKIEIHDRFTFVAVKKSVSERALASLREGRIKGRRFRVERVG